MTPATNKTASSNAAHQTAETRRDAGQAASDRLREHRARQALIAEVLNGTFGTPSIDNMDPRDRQTYLTLVGLVYDRLSGNDAVIPTKELAPLARIFSESRRAAARSREDERTTGDDQPTATGDRPLPRPFADIVRQVYGTNFQTPENAPPQDPDPHPARKDAGAGS